MKEPNEKREVINMESLLRIISPSSKTSPIKSVSSPTAQTNKLCEVQDDQLQLLEAVYSKRLPLLNSDRILWYIIELMLNGALRVSEVLDIDARDITMTGHVIIHGKKGSLDRIVTTHDSAEYLRKCKVNCVQPFMDWNRFAVYRAFKKHGIYLQLSGNKHMSVTHSIRQIVSRSMQTEGVSDNMRRKLLGHKSFNSLKHYSNDQKGEHSEY